MKRETAAYMQAKVQTQRQVLARRELELVSLREEMARTERALDEMTRNVGARSQRVDVGTMTSNLGSVKQVGADMAAAIRKRQERRKMQLRDKLQKSQQKLDADVACNRKMHDEINHRRANRLAHLVALRRGGQHVHSTALINSNMIVAAQRAYAERETCVARIGEVRRELAQKTESWRHEMEGTDAELRECDGEVTTRERELEVAEAAAAAVLAAVRREEAEAERELDQFADVRNRRLELHHGLEQIFAAVAVASVEELHEAYGTLSAKLLSLWQKHASQAEDLELLEEERRGLQREYSRHGGHAADLASLYEGVTSAEPSGGGFGGGRPGAEDDGLEAAELALSELAEAVHSCVRELAGTTGGEEEGRAGACASPNNLLSMLGAVEAAAVRVARQHRGVLQLEADADAAQASVWAAANAQAEGEASEGPASLPAASLASPNAPSPSHRSLAIAKTDDGRRKKRESPLDALVGRGPPSMEGIVHEHAKGDDVVLVQVGTGEARYRRRSLRAELMSQILAGVDSQKEKLHAEEVLVRIGERVRSESATELRGVDKAKRDLDISHWLARRHYNSGASKEGRLQDGRALRTAVSEAGLASPNAKLAAAARDRLGSAESHLVSNAQHRAGSPGTFSNTSLREVLDAVSRSRSDAGRVAHEVAARLPRMSPSAASSAPTLTASRSLAVLERGNERGSLLDRPPNAAKPRQSRHAPPASATAPNLLAPGAAHRGLTASASSPNLVVPGEGTISELQGRLSALQAERRQIRELKALATAKPARSPAKASYAR